MKITRKDLPQLIIGLDSLDDAANYVHIADVKDDHTYYCPCCRGIIKPRAYKKEVEYQVQPHFYHESGGCSEESYVHYICKNWLFKAGCKFIVSDIQYEVEKIDVEKTLHTSFGDYRPDIIVTTTSGKVFYFEIKMSNRKSELYAPKWDELGNDVVEVDVRYFINQKYANEIPVFDLIYSDGECFIKSYTKKDYEETIAKRKIEWKRQDKLNYKIQWERLDWFWNALSEYISGNKTDSDVIEQFKLLDYEDKLWCYYMAKNKSCVKLKEQFKKCLNEYFYDMAKSVGMESGIDIVVIQISPLIYEIKGTITFEYLDYTLHESNAEKIHVAKGGILTINHKKEIEKIIEHLLSFRSFADKQFEKANSKFNLPFVKSIVPKSHLMTENQNLSNVWFVISFTDYNLCGFVKQLETSDQLFTCLSKRRTATDYGEAIKEAKKEIRKKIYLKKLNENEIYQDLIRYIEDLCESKTDLNLSLKIIGRQITILSEFHEIYSHEFKALPRDFDQLKNEVDQVINEHIQKMLNIKAYIEKINSCKNKMWSAEKSNDNYIKIFIYDPSSKLKVADGRIDIYELSEDIEKDLHNTMINLLEQCEYLGIRFLEVR